MNYQNGKIYRIVCNETGEQYIGSTCQTLSKRLTKHRSCYKSYINNKHIKNIASFNILKRNNYNIILIENFPCNSKEELLQREQYYIEKLPNINNQNAFTTEEYKKKYMKDYRIEYREENKEELNKNHMDYYLKNSEKFKCECGKYTCKYSLKQHSKSFFHIKYISNI